MDGLKSRGQCFAVAMVIFFGAAVAWAADDASNYLPTGFHYAVLDIGDLLGAVGGNYPAGISNAGSIVAYGPRFVTDSTRYGFLWSNGQLFSTKDSIGGFVPIAVNDHDNVVGVTGGAYGGVWTPGSQASGFQLQGDVVGINDDGTIVWGPAPRPDQIITWAGTNYQGQFVGYYSGPGGGDPNLGARLYDRGSLVGLPFAEASGINKGGVIVGSIADLQPGNFYNYAPIMYTNSTVYRLSSLPSLNDIYGLDTVAGINDYGQMVARVAGINSHDIVRVTPFKAYSQAGSTWSTLPLNPNYPSSRTIGAVGCTLVSLTTVATYFGAHVSPLDVRDALLGSNISHNVIALNAGQTFTFDNASFDITSREYGYDQIVNALRRGEPVMLRVPSLRTGTVDDAGHYIVAYQFVQGVTFGSANITPDQIDISDPGSFPNTLTTLGAYFRSKSSPVRSFSPKTWFDTGRDDSGTYQEQNLNHLVTTFSRVIPGVSGAAPGGPMIAVHSPVELIITDGPNRFATSPDLAQFGETVLPHLHFDAALADDADPLAAEDSIYPPYFVQLPPELAGVSLDIEVHGVAYGSYEVTYLSGDQRYLSKDVLTGDAFPESVDLGHFAVTEAPTPEPSSGLLSSLIGLALLLRPTRGGAIRVSGWG